MPDTNQTTKWPDYATAEIRQALANIAFAHERARNALNDYISFGTPAENEHRAACEIYFDVTGRAAAALEEVLADD